MEYNEFGQPIGYTQELADAAGLLGIKAPKVRTELETRINPREFLGNSPALTPVPSLEITDLGDKSLTGAIFERSSIFGRGFDENRPDQKTGLAGTLNYLKDWVNGDLNTELNAYDHQQIHEGYNPYKFALESGLEDYLNFFDDKTTPTEAENILRYKKENDDVAKAMGENPTMSTVISAVSMLADPAAAIPMVKAAAMYSVVKNAGLFAGLTAGQSYYMSDEKAPAGDVVAAAGIGALFGAAFGGLSRRSYLSSQKALAGETTNIVAAEANTGILKSTPELAIEPKSSLAKLENDINQTAFSIPRKYTDEGKFTEPADHGHYIIGVSKKDGTITYVDGIEDMVKLKKDYDFYKNEDPLDVSRTRFLSKDGTINTVGHDKFYLVKTRYLDRDYTDLAPEQYDDIFGNPLGSGKYVTDDIRFVKENAKKAKGGAFKESFEIQEKPSALNLYNADEVIPDTIIAKIEPRIREITKSKFLVNEGENLVDLFKRINALKLAPKEYKEIVDGVIKNAFRELNYQGYSSTKIKEGSKVASLFEGVSAKNHKVNYQKITLPSKMTKVDVDDYKAVEQFTSKRKC